jgi:hypothetical protein
MSSDGSIVLLASGKVVLQASFNGLTAYKEVQAAYQPGTTSQTIVNPDGSVTTVTYTTVENDDGSTTTTGEA